VSVREFRPEDLESIPCPSCGGESHRQVIVSTPNKPEFGGRFSIVECETCGLIHANPRLGLAALSEAYGALERADQEPAVAIANRRAGMFTRWWRHITQRKIVGDWVERGPVLDVGCDVGGLLLKLQRRGLQVTGIESSPAAVALCRAQGLDVIQGIVEEVKLDDSSFQTITLSHSLEHVPDPVAVLRKLWRALAPGGKIVIAVPNHCGLVARLFGAQWQGWDPPFHLTHFDSKSLRAVLEVAGFHVERVYTHGNPEDVTRSLSKALGRPVNMLWLRAALLPGAWALGRLTQGGELCAVARRPTGREVMDRPAETRPS